jgi:hypothetical protein
MSEAPPPLTEPRRIGLGGWVAFVIGGYILGTVFLGIGFVVGLVLRWPTSWDALTWAIPALTAASIAVSALIMGRLLHVRGVRQWLTAFGSLTIVLYVIPLVVPPVARFVQGV